jgi:uncharacterized protein (AIM24 family)
MVGAEQFSSWKNCYAKIASEIHIIHSILSLMCMNYQILKEPMSLLEIQLNKEEEVTGEAGAMVYIRGNIEVKTATRSGGGFFKKYNYVAHEDNCFIGLTGPPIGDIVRMSINANNGLIVHSGAYIASSTGVMLDTEWQGFKKGIFGNGLFMLKANGEGDLFVNAYGGIIRKVLLYL